MRPFGHDGTREERDARETIDTRLQRAWKGFSREALRRPLSDNTELAASYMASYSFSLQGLHHLILSTPHDDVHVAKNLGVFVSAGYNLLPDEEIYYDLETPYLSHLGYRLRHKHLIIDGTVNSMLGYAMIGRLTINGTVGVSAGSYMTGTLVNNGATGHDLGKEMIGVLTSNKKMSNDGTGMLGVHNGQWVSAFAYINWPGLCERFKKSLTFALTLPDNEIRRYLRERYMYDGELYEAHR